MENLYAYIWASLGLGLGYRSTSHSNFQNHCYYHDYGPLFSWGENDEVFVKVW